MTCDKIYDITARLRPGMPVWPGDAGFVLTWPNRIERGDAAHCSRVEMGVHTGTHIDSPWHFLADGAPLDTFGPERFVLPATVVECDDPRTVGPQCLRGAPIDPGQAVLFKTPNSRRQLLDRQEFTKDYVFLSPQAAQACLDRKASLVGIDYLSIDAFEAPGYPAHMLLLKAGVLLLEGLDLRDAPPGRYTLIALPLKLTGTEGSPVRAVLLKC